jgi:hypothetical protein
MTGGVHHRGSTPSPASFRPQGFAPSRRLAPPPVLRACCIPLPRPGFLPFRGFSRFAAVPARRRALPPCRWLVPADRRTGRHECNPRLRGLAPRIEACFGVRI